LLLTFDNKRYILLSMIDTMKVARLKTRRDESRRGRLRVCSTSAAVAAFLGVLAAQTPAPPAFDVASVKQDDTGGNYIEAARGTLSAHSATPATCIMWAYGVQSSQISSANPAVSNLLQSARYTIVAKAAGPAPENQMRIMLQTLLAERFQLALHRQSRETRVFALVLDKNGPKFHASGGDGESKMQASSKVSRRWTFTTMAQLANSLADAVQAPVLDETGLAGKYDFALDLTPYLPANGERPDFSAMMISAVREQLGLKLEARRAATDILVIDRLERPTEN
jgi:uncharacterized protein (TIGR03435 family)